MNSEEPQTRGDVGHGALVGLAFHMVGIPAVLAAAAALDHLLDGSSISFFGLAFVYVGVTQWVYMLPAYLIFSKRGAPKGFLKGLVLAAVVLFLLNAGCLGTIGVGFQNSH
ncbi:MAG: hypothetical protein JKY61_07740 [Planctomycetes bacterium]|nr:hypothetical protein [Planctomycetota bacterium]